MSAIISEICGRIGRSHIQKTMSMNIKTTITAVLAFLAEIKFRNKRKTASIAHVITENWHETHLKVSGKASRKFMQVRAESSLLELCRAQLNFFNEENPLA